MKHRIYAFAAVLLLVSAYRSIAGVRIEQIPGQAEPGRVEIHGVSAGPFDMKMWEAGTLHFVREARLPLIAPRLAGVYRNIYAPSPVQIPGGWRVFYGAWDGTDTGNDRIYSVDTKDFLDFGERRTEIEHGTFQHVCNVNAMRLPDGSFRMICTAYPDAKKLNKPAFFTSPDGKNWNGSPAPYAAQAGDVVTMEGYPGYDAADINGINVLTFENNVYHLYFGNFTAHGHVHRASSTDGKHYTYEGICLDTRHMVNDVKKLKSGDKTVYLMGLHGNTSRLWYSLSDDGMKFGPERELAGSLAAMEKYIVAIGWVIRDQSVLGFLYGAGPAGSLDRNKIYARWLQKKIVFTGEGGKLEEMYALGPDRQTLLTLGKTQCSGKIEIYSEDGKTPLCEPLPIKLIDGAVYRIVWDNKP